MRHGGAILGLGRAAIMCGAFILLVLATMLPSVGSTGAAIALRVLYAALFAGAIIGTGAAPWADIHHAGKLLRSLARRQ